MSFHIVTDSASDIPEVLINKWDISVCRLTARYKGESYPDGFDRIGFEEFYDSLKAGETSTTSQVNASQFEEVFRNKLKEYDNILYIGFSTALSGTYQSAVNAKQTIADEDQALADRIILIDTLCASLGSVLLINEAVKLRDSGKSAQETAEYIESRKMFVNHWFTVDDLNFLKRGGRISALTATVGSILGVKPVLKVSKEGTLVSVDKAKGRKKALAALYDKYMERKFPEQDLVMIVQANAQADAEYLKDMILKNSNPNELLICQLGMVIGSHAGPGTIGLFFMGKSREEE